MRGGACTCPPAVLPIGILFAGLWGEAGVHVQQNFRCPWNGICRGTADNDDPKPFIRTLTVEEIVGNVMSVDARNALVDGLPGRPWAEWSGKRTRSVNSMRCPPRMRFTIAMVQAREDV